MKNGRGRMRAIDELVGKANPVRHEDVQGWVDSAEALEIRERVLSLRSAAERQRKSRRLFRRGVVISVAIALVASALAAAYVGSRPTTDVFSLACSPDTRMSQLAIVSVRDGESPEQTCASRWQSMFQAPAPANLTSCVIQPGGTVVFPESVRHGE